MDVSIIIVNYNTKDLTAACIDSIFQYTKDVEFEVILVDNASTDGSKEFFRLDSRIIFVESETNLGFGRANNLGYKYSSGDYIFLLNSDTYLLNNAIKEFHEKMLELPLSVACIGANLIGEDGLPVHSYGDFIKFNYSWKSVLESMSRKHALYSPCMNNMKVPYVTGADLFIRKSVIQECGFFDPLFFMYYEDNDLQRTYAKAGYEARIVEGPAIVHLEGQSNVYKINILYTCSNFAYIRKWYSYPKYLLYRMVYAFTHFPKIFIRRIPWKQRVLYLKTLMFYKVNYKFKV